MTTREPNLLTLLDWSRRRAAGQPCASWEAWRSSTPQAARRADELLRVALWLESDNAPLGTTELGASDVAQLIEGELPPDAESLIEDICFRSPVQLCEVASNVRFRRDAGELPEVSSDLTRRLLAIGPAAAKRRKRTALASGPGSRPARLGGSRAALNTVAPSIAVRPHRRAMPRADKLWRYWPLAAAAAALVVAAIGGAIGWSMHVTDWSNNDRVPVVREPAGRPTQDQIRSEPSVNRIVTITPTAPEPDQSAAVRVAPQLPLPPIAIDDRPAAVARQHPIPAPRDAPRLDASIQSAIGAVLVDPGQRGRLRVGRGAYSLAEPLRLVSLAESWSRVEIPVVGTLVCDGAVEATIASWGDGVLEIQLAYGRLGIERLPAGQQIRIQSGTAQWQATGTANYSTLAVIHDPERPRLFVPTGAVAVEGVEVKSQEIVEITGGAVQPPQPLVASGAADSDSLAGRWLSPPEEARRKKWQGQYGKLLDKLAIVDDASQELPLIFASTRDTRQAALLAQWNLSVADEATRVQQNWDLLGDRRELVRIAAVRSILELPPGDPRLTNMIRFVRSRLGDDLGSRVAQWFRWAHQPGQIAAPQAVELAEFLGHRDLAMRQLAVSILELHAAPALARARLAPPDFDAAGSAGKRLEAQRQWRQLIRQLFAPQRNGPNAIIPNPLGVQPVAGNGAPPAAGNAVPPAAGNPAQPAAKNPAPPAAKNAPPNP